MSSPANVSGVPSDWSEKSYGVMLIGSNGSRDWTKTAQDLRKALGAQKPLEVISSDLGSREIQKALSRFEAAKVKKIVVIPLQLHSNTKEVDQLRYLLGMRELPSKEYLEAWHLQGRLIPRIKTKLAITMSGGLDAHGVSAEIHAEHAKNLSQKPAQESVVLVGFGSSEDEANTQQQQVLDSLGSSIQKKGNFKVVTTALMRPATKEKPKLAADSENRLRDMIKNLSINSRVIVLVHLLSLDGQERTLRKKLDNLFFRWKGRALLPDDRIVQWAKLKAEETAQLENMVKFKDTGKKIPALKMKKK